MAALVVMEEMGWIGMLHMVPAAAAAVAVGQRQQAIPEMAALVVSMEGVVAEQAQAQEQAGPVVMLAMARKALSL